MRTQKRNIKAETNKQPTNVIDLSNDDIRDLNESNDNDDDDDDDNDDDDDIDDFIESNEMVQQIDDAVSRLSLNDSSLSQLHELRQKINECHTAIETFFSKSDGKDISNELAPDRERIICRRKFTTLDWDLLMNRDPGKGTGKYENFGKYRELMVDEHGLYKKRDGEKEKFVYVSAKDGLYLLSKHLTKLRALRQQSFLASKLKEISGKGTLHKADYHRFRYAIECAQITICECRTMEDFTQNILYFYNKYN